MIERALVFEIFIVFKWLACHFVDLRLVTAVVLMALLWYCGPVGVYTYPCFAASSCPVCTVLLLEPLAR